MEGWSDFFYKENWQKAYEECGINPEEYTGEQPLEDLLAWDMIDMYIDKKFLLAERERAYGGVSSKSCKSGCKACGIQKIYRCEI